jgi:hypothetical protein
MKHKSHTSPLVEGAHGSIIGFSLSLSIPLLYTKRDHSNALAHCTSNKKKKRRSSFCDLSKVTKNVFCDYFGVVNDNFNCFGQIAK